MPGRGSHFTGPIRNAPKRGSLNDRSWFSELPVGMTDPDYTHLLYDFQVATDYDTTKWTITGAGTPTAAVGTTTNINGLLTLTTTNTSADACIVQGKQDSWKLDTTAGADPAGKRLWFEASVKPSNVATLDMFVGLSEIQSDVITSSQNYVGFRMTTGAATLAYQTALAGTQTSVTTVYGGSASTYSMLTTAQTLLGFTWAQGNHINFFVNRAYVATISTNLPTAGMAPAFDIITNSANARTLLVDYIYIAKER